jgi:hypothetical protein
MKTKLLSVSIIAILLLGTFAIFPNAYAVPTTVDIVPNPINYDTDTAYVGMKFNVTVSVNNVVNLAGIQLYVDFDDAVINFTRWFVPSPNIFSPKTTSALPTPPDGNYQHLVGKGKILVSLSLFPTPPTQPPVSGSGAVAIIEFVVKQLPPKLGSLTSQLHIDTSDTYLLDGDGLEIACTKNDGTYTITWKAPAAPTLVESPGSITFPGNLLNVGTTFNEVFQLQGLSAAWFLTTASFTMTYNATVKSIVGGLADVTVDPLWTLSTVTITENPDPTILDTLDVAVSTPSSNPSGTVVICTVMFTVMIQQMPPNPPANYDYSDEVFSGVFLEDHIGPVPVTVGGPYTIISPCYNPAVPPWFVLVPSSVTLGPAPAIGTEFDVGVKITGEAPNYLDESIKLIGIQFRLFYDDTLLEVVSVTEGPFLLDPTWNLYGTFFVSSVEGDGLGPHVLIGDLLLPNGVGEWDQTTFPNGQGIVATVRFRAIKQECPDAFETDLILGSVFGEWGINKYGDYVTFDETKMGTCHYTMLPFDTPGRVIDLTGGADNRGYWAGYPLPFPAPFGGQGLNHWMDIVFPQSEITLYALVTYNYWPVQSKDVGFEIEGPFDKLPNGTLVPRPVYYKIWAKFTATTGVDGVATITFRMPWPCDNPDMITGVWVITATATVADVLIIDTMPFYYERLVYITSVTTDKFYYVHEEYVKVTVNYQTHAVQFYPALFAVVLTDDLGVPFGMALVTKSVGGAVWCTWKTGTFEVSIFIPKYAYAGYGHVHVSCFDKDPTVGGFAWCPEYAPAPEFQIGPY